MSEHRDPPPPDDGPTDDDDTRHRDRRRFGEVLVDAGVVSDATVAEALRRAEPGERLGTALLRLGYVEEEQVADALATQLRLPRIDVADARPEPAALARVPARIAAKHALLPLRIDDEVLTVATDDPTDVVAFDDVRLAAGVRSVRAVVATPSALAAARQRARRGEASHGVLEELDAVAATRQPPSPPAAAERSGAPVVRLVDAVLADAVASRASDVHIEPDASGVAVRVRVDGLLREVMRLPTDVGRQVTSRLKIIAAIDIAERRLPQDGRALLNVGGDTLDLRIATMPTMHGETVVLRLLPQGTGRLRLDELGLPSAVRDAFLEVLRRPQGLVLVTGPTGSGKTTTLYAGLDAVADPTRNVLTLEDPVELELDGVNQTQVDPKIGLTFARGLRHVLRQDPDVVLVGEIRDRETAELAVEASFTGHLVLATLHTNDAPSSVARLVDLGADPFLVASSLLLVVAQRLARRVCDHCAVPDEPDPSVLRRLGLDPAALTDAAPRRGAGCARCEDTGVLGRVAIGESLHVSTRMRELVTNRAPETVLGEVARAEGLRQLRQDAVTRALGGEITVEEALRVTPAGDPASRCPACQGRIAPDFVVCPHCAHELAGDTCARCGRETEDGWATCPWCRAPLRAADRAPDR